MHPTWSTLHLPRFYPYPPHFTPLSPFSPSFPNSSLADQPNSPNSIYTPQVTTILPWTAPINTDRSTPSFPDSTLMRPRHSLHLAVPIHLSSAPKILGNFSCLLTVRRYSVLISCRRHICYVGSYRRSCYLGCLVICLGCLVCKSNLFAWVLDQCVRLFKSLFIFYVVLHCQLLWLFG